MYAKNKRGPSISLLSSLNTRKATGADGIAAKMLKATCPSIDNSLTKLFTLSLMSGRFPSDWRFARVVPIPKVRNPASPSNYTLLLEKHVHNLLYQHLDLRSNGDLQIIHYCCSIFSSMNAKSQWR